MWYYLCVYGRSQACSGGCPCPAHAPHATSPAHPPHPPSTQPHSTAGDCRCGFPGPLKQRPASWTAEAAARFPSVAGEGPRSACTRQDFLAPRLARPALRHTSSSITTPSQTQLDASRRGHAVPRPALHAPLSFNGIYSLDAADFGAASGRRPSALTRPACVRHTARSACAGALGLGSAPPPSPDITWISHPLSQPLSRAPEAARPNMQRTQPKGSASRRVCLLARRPSHLSPRLLRPPHICTVSAQHQFLSPVSP